jgi:hypothetical protein
MALKFLATLNEGLISALRGADLRLMQLDPQRTTAEMPKPCAPPSGRIVSNAAEPHRRDIKFDNSLDKTKSWPSSFADVFQASSDECMVARHT